MTLDDLRKMHRPRRLPALPAAPPAAQRMPHMFIQVDEDNTARYMVQLENGNIVPAEDYVEGMTR